MSWKFDGRNYSDPKLLIFLKKYVIYTNVNVVFNYPIQFS